MSNSTNRGHPVDIAACPPELLPFYCPTSTNCIPTLVDNSSVICCPQGESCQYIQPVTCEIQQQNQTAYPGNVIHTTQLDAVLASCGAQCCPLGYACMQSICVLTGVKPTLSPSSSLTLVTATAMATTTASTSTFSTAAAISSPGLSTHAGAIIGGCIGGAAALALLCVLVLLLYGCRIGRFGKQKFDRHPLLSSRRPSKLGVIDLTEKGPVELDTAHDQRSELPAHERYEADSSSAIDAVSPISPIAATPRTSRFSTSTMSSLEGSHLSNTPGKQYTPAFDDAISEMPADEA